MRGHVVKECIYRTGHNNKTIQNIKLRTTHSPKDCLLIGGADDVIERHPRRMSMSRLRGVPVVNSPLIVAMYRPIDP